MPLSPLPVIVLLACALAWSGFDVTRKALAERIAPMPLLLLLTAGQTVLFALWTRQQGWPVVSERYWLPAAVSVALNVVANLALFQAFRLSPISVIVPLLSLTPVFTTLAAIPLLGEVPRPRQLAGIVLVVIGALVLNLRTGPGSGPGPGLEAPAGVFVREPGVPLMVLVTLCWSLTPPLDKLALEASSPAFHATLLCAAVAAVIFALLAYQRRLGEVRHLARGPGLYAAALAVSALGLALQFLAYRLFLVAMVETVKRGIGNVLALVNGRLFFAERVGTAKIVAVAMMGVGVALVLI